jgi:hypothetical protein
MFARTDTAIRRAMLQPPSGSGLEIQQPRSAGSVFTQGFLNASLLQLAICAPPRRAVTRRYSEVYITELGERARSRTRVVEREVVAE